MGTKPWNVVSFDITGDVKEVLRAAVDIALTENHLVAGYKAADDGSSITLTWHASDKTTSVPLPFKMTDASRITDFLWDWLHQKDAEWPSVGEEVIGCSTRKGFKVDNEFAGGYQVINLTRYTTVYCQ